MPFYCFYCTFKGTGPVTYKSHKEGKQFQNAINALRAHAGGDCPELTFKGILDGMAESPNYGSPLYVFTDATAKDATKDNIIEVLQFAEDTGITINFFTTGLCGHSSYGPFEKLASETCGQMLKLPNSSELKKLSGITGVTLAGTTCLLKGNSGSSSGKKKRSPRGSSYSHTVFLLMIQQKRSLSRFQLKEWAQASISEIRKGLLSLQGRSPCPTGPSTRSIIQGRGLGS